MNPAVRRRLSVVTSRNLAEECRLEYPQGVSCTADPRQPGRVRLWDHGAAGRRQGGVRE